jgi:putative ATP-dependent endonuclease of the OLD family
MPPRIEKLSVKNLRSIGGEGVTIRFPQSGALVLLGENNAGKSNITRALDVMFGDYWPGTRRLEDHDFHGRDGDGVAVEVGAAVSGIACPYCSGGEVEYFRWTYDTQDTGTDGKPVKSRWAQVARGVEDQRNRGLPCTVTVPWAGGARR